MNALTPAARASIVCAALAALAGCGAASQHSFSPSLGMRSARNPLPAHRPTASYRVVYNFDGSAGANPIGGLTVVKGLLYGTADAGGSNCLSYGGCGTVFSLTTAGVEHTLYNFRGSGDGANPWAGLTVMRGLLYGTTADSFYVSGSGTVFSITPSGTEHTLHVFEGSSDAGSPEVNMVVLNGALYGTTFYGGTDHVGAIFRITAGGRERVVYSFKYGGRDGTNPEGDLTVLNGKMYGTTYYGGTTGDGTVFSITPAGGERVLYSFQGGSDGSHPQAGLTVLNGTLYGTTYVGGTHGHGTVFSVTTAGSEHVLYSFRSRNDGLYPTADMVVLNGVLYGTTDNGGGYGYGYGTVFSITPAGKERVLHAFQGPPNDGQLVLGSLTVLHGTLYGTTDIGGTNDAGTVFALTP